LIQPQIKGHIEGVGANLALKNKPYHQWNFEDLHKVEEQLERDFKRLVEETEND